MTQTLIELIEGIDFGSTPPCVILDWSGEPCLKPSAWRIKVTCPVHGHATAFICQDCLGLAGEWGLYHAGCRENLSYALV